MGLIADLLGEDGESTRERIESMQERADEAVSDRVDGPLSPEELGVSGVAVVNEGPDGEPVVVPIARVSLAESRETLDRDAAWSYVPETLRVMHETFDDVFVRHYDVQFAYDGDGLFEAREVDRVAVRPETVERLGEPSFDGDDLQAYVEREDDIDDQIAPVAWRDAMDYGQSSDAAVVTAASVSASAAACAGASASAGACGAGGG